MFNSTFVGGIGQTAQHKMEKLYFRIADGRSVKSGHRVLYITGEMEFNRKNLKSLVQRIQRSKNATGSPVATISLGDGSGCTIENTAKTGCEMSWTFYDGIVGDVLAPSYSGWVEKLPVSASADEVVGTFMRECDNVFKAIA